jgi:hypothetical protein
MQLFCTHADPLKALRALGRTDRQRKVARESASYPRRQAGFSRAQPVKRGRCATHSEMPITAAEDSGDRSRNA